MHYPVPDNKWKRDKFYVPVAEISTNKCEVLWMARSMWAGLAQSPTRSMVGSGTPVVAIR